jgi:EAL domain-containing protein (putative c-di-GMP-specific phosphodiesterase class I)
MGTSRRGITGDLMPHIRMLTGLNDLHVAFQPIVSLSDGKIFAYEALLRSMDDDFPGPPAVLERVIENDGCGELGRVVRDLAVETCQDAPLFLNVHPREFEDGWVVRPDDPIFRHEHAVYIEITESVPMSHESYCRGTLSEIRDKGIKLAVDDLGAGYSNLLYIAQLNPEIVKLDRELTASAAGDRRSQRLLEGIVDLCKKMNAKVVAEGVETIEELEGVRAAGVDYVQGYLFGRPEIEPQLAVELPA